MSQPKTADVVPIQQRKAPVPVNRPIADLDQAWRLAQNLAVANLLPTALHGRPSDVMAIILYGQDLGLSPMQAIQGIYVVEGRPSISAQLWLALVRRAGHQAKVIEHTDTSCAVQMKRGDTGEEHEVTYTLQNGVTAGRVTLKDGKPFARSQKGKPLPWELQTKAMLLARAVSACARFLCPEVAFGFYTPDEVEEIAEREQVPSDRLDDSDFKPVTFEDGAQQAAAANDQPAEAEPAKESSEPEPEIDDEQIQAAVAELDEEYDPAQDPNDPWFQGGEQT